MKRQSYTTNAYISVNMGVKTLFCDGHTIHGKMNEQNIHRLEELLFKAYMFDTLSRGDKIKSFNKAIKDKDVLKKMSELVHHNKSLKDILK